MSTMNINDEIDKLLPVLKEYLDANPSHQYKGQTLYEMFQQLSEKSMTTIPLRPTANQKFKMKQADKKDNCVFIGTKQTFGARTLAWSVCDTNQCYVTFCFDVDEVRKHIGTTPKCHQNSATKLKQQNELPSSCKNSNEMCAVCPMFGVGQMRKVIREKGVSVDIPDDMPDEFREVITNFEIVKRSQTTLKSDNITRAVRTAIETYVAQQIEKGEAYFKTSRLGLFWTFTTKVLQPLVKKGWWLTWKIIDNPFWVMVITTIAKMIRISFCIYTSFPTLGPKILDILLEKVVGDIENIGKGIPFLIATFAKTVVSCLSTIGTSWNLSGIFDACGSSLVTRNLGALANIVGEIVGPILKSLLDSVGLSAVADFGAVLLSKPSVILNMIWESDPNARTEARIEYGIRTVISRFELQDWNMAAFLFFLSYCPTSLLHTALTTITAYLAPALLPLLAIAQVHKDYNPVKLFQFMTKQVSIATYTMQFLREVQEWFFDLLPCFLSTYLPDTVKYYFKNFLPETTLTMKQNPDVIVTCCLTDLIVNLQKEINRMSEAEVLDKVRETYDSAKAWIWSWFQNPSDETTKEAQAKIDELVSEVGFANDVLLETREVQIGQQTIRIPDSFAAELNPTNETIIPKAKSIMRRVLAVFSDARHKIKVFDHPIFTLYENGAEIHFYVFVWKPEIMLHDGYQMHVSVMAQEMERLFPRSVFEFHGHKLILLRYLPQRIVDHIIMLQNPIIDLSVFATQT